MEENEYKTPAEQRERANLYYKENKGKVSEYYKALPEERKEKRRATARAWRKKNKERKSEYDKKWREENPGEWRELAKRQRQKPEVKMVSNLRKRLREFVKKANGRSSVLFGCSPTQLRSHIESKFVKGMKWDNYGDWHIDHIRPCSSFDLYDLEQRKQCFHWSNLQPLWASDNIEKSNKWNQEANNKGRFSAC